MDYTKNYENWINGLTKPQFDIFIKLFIKDHYAIEDVVITDGKGDGGIDVKILDRKKRKIPMQITIDQNLYGKLEKDLLKVEELIDKYDFKQQFLFFYSRGASEKKVIELKHIAETKHEISLDIFDNKMLAMYLNKPEYTYSRQYLREILGGFINGEDTYVDKHQKMYFDYLTYGNQTIELKEQFVISFIIQFLYQSNEVTIDLIIKEIQREFTIEISKAYVDRMINKLMTHKRIIKSLNKYKLSSEEKLNIKRIYDSSDMLEIDFSSQLQNIIINTNSDLDIKILLQKLKELFRSHYKLDLNSVVNDFDLLDTNDKLLDLKHYVSQVLIDHVKSRQFIIDVFKLCEVNNILLKISAGNMFKDLMETPGFSNYSNSTNKDVFIDTPVLIFIFLGMYPEDVDYDNYRYQICKELFELISSGDTSARYATSKLYIKELADYIKTAINYIEIVDSGILSTLGGSNNEIIQFFLHLKHNIESELTFRDFLEKFGINVSNVLKDNSTDYLENYIIQLFEDNDIEAIFVPKNQTTPELLNLTKNVQKTLTDIYTANVNNRNNRSLNFDTYLFVYLDSNYENLVDPTVITWDKTFYSFRKTFNQENPRFKLWHLFSPGRYLDHYSLMKFKINSKVITKEFISIIDAEYDVLKNTRKVTDILSTIIDLRSEKGVALTKGLSKIKIDSIYDEKDEIENIKKEQTNEILEDFFNDLLSYYQNKEGKYTLAEFKNSLQNDNMIKGLLAIIQEYMKKSINDFNFKLEYDLLIKNSETKNENEK